MRKELLFEHFGPSYGNYELQSHSHFKREEKQQ